MNRGFLSFALAAVFALALFSSVSMQAAIRPDRSYERYRAYEIQETAVKQVFRSSVSAAASDSIVLSASSGAASYAHIVAAALQGALGAQDGLQKQGFEVSFWCGSPTDAERQQASAEMLRLGRPAAPAGTLPLERCAHSFSADLLSRTIHFKDIGFSFYSQELAIGRAAMLPSGYEEGF